MDKLPKTYNKMSKKELKKKLLEIFNDQEYFAGSIDTLIKDLKFLSSLIKA